MVDLNLSSAALSEAKTERPVDVHVPFGVADRDGNDDDGILLILELEQ